METNSRFDLTGRVALLTGANSHGIGNAAAKLLARNGAKVFLIARRKQQLEYACDEIKANGGQAAFRAMDVSNEAECKAAVKQCVKEFGRLDIMVLSAGISGLSASGGMEAIFDTENWKKMLSINLDGVFWMIKHGHAECAKHGVGSIIPVSSLAAWHAAGSAAYTASKGAIRSLIPYFGKALAPMKIRVNSLSPGMIDTDMTHGACSHKQYGPAIKKNIPLGRFGEVEDMAYGILFLASDASSFMTGQHLIMDGGELC